MNGAEDADGLSMFSQPFGRPRFPASGARGQPSEDDLTP